MRPVRGQGPRPIHARFECSRIHRGSTIDATLREKVYDGPPLSEWTAYYWRMRVQIDSLKNDGTHVIYWQEEYTFPFTFFYFTTNVIQIYKDPQVTHLPNIQTALIWAASGDTVWVDTGTYYENLRFYKKGVVLTSRYKDDLDTTWIKQTVSSVAGKLPTHFCILSS